MSLQIENETPIKMDLGEGAFGKTLFIKVPSFSTLERIKTIFSELGNGPVTHYEFFPNTGIIGEQIEKLNLKCSEQETVGTSAIKCISDGQLEWVQTSAGWFYSQGLIQGLINEKKGHQYLTNETKDAVLVVISFNEE